MLDDIDLDIPEDPQPERRGNRTFLVVAGILGLILLLALIAMAVYAFFIRPNQLAAEEETAGQQTQTQVALVLQATETPLPDTSTPTSTNTATPTDVPATDTPTATEVTPIFTEAAGPATQTVESLLTQAAAAQTDTVGDGPTPTPVPTSEDLPDAGFADDVGFPGLVLAAAVLVAVILAARRLRTA